MIYCRCLGEWSRQKEAFHVHRKRGRIPRLHGDRIRGKTGDEVLEEYAKSSMQFFADDRAGTHDSSFPRLIYVRFVEAPAGGIRKKDF